MHWHNNYSEVGIWLEVHMLFIRRLFLLCALLFGVSFSFYTLSSSHSHIQLHIGKAVLYHPEEGLDSRPKRRMIE